ncbi:MAG TPA: SPFH domain-containing protein [Candidatus Paceibacterota bacterium]
MDAKLVTAAAVGALLVGASVATPFILSGWANDNFLYTKIPEGTGKIIVKGKSFHRALLSFKGYHLNDPRNKATFNPEEPEWEILPNTDPKKKYDTRPPFTRAFGLYLIGIPGMRSIYEYRFAWNEYRTGSEGAQHLRHRDELTEIFMANDFPYVMVVENVKTKDNLPVRAEFVIIVRITNPRKALFETNDWRTQLESYVDRQARNFIGSFTYDELRSETDEGKERNEENFSNPIRDLTNCLPEEEDLPEDQRKGTKRTIGITVKAGNLESIDLSGAAAAENERLSIAAYQGDREAELTTKAAEAEATSIKLRADARAHETRVTGEAEAASITARMEALGKDPELGKTMIVAEALKSPGNGKVIVVPSSVVDIASKIAEKV